MPNRSRSEYHKSIKYIIQINDLIKCLVFFSATMEANTNLLAEIRKSKNVIKLESNSIEGHRGDTNIAQTCSDKYRQCSTCPIVTQLDRNMVLC